MQKLWERLQTLFINRSPDVDPDTGEPAPREKTEQEVLLGRKGESHAAAYLKRKGFRILVRNFATPVGEIDIIARDKECLVFVEVKTRVDEEIVAPQEQVNPHKMHQLTKAAKYYLGRYPPPMPPARFDVVSIVWPPAGQPTVKHIEHAFEATF